MSIGIRLLSLAMLLAAVLASCPVFAAGEGQEDLDKATEIKLTANTLSDLNNVIALIESALKKGLDEVNTQYANKLLSSTLIQRAQETIKQIFTDVSSPDVFHQRFQSAKDDLEKSIKLDPKQPQAFMLIAQLNLLPGGSGIKGVREAVDKAIELGIEDPAEKSKALVLRASLQEKPEAKLADFDEAVRLMPDDAATVRSRGEALADMEKYDQALVDLDKAILLAPQDGSTYEIKAIVLSRMKKYDEALAALDKARQLSPDSEIPLLQKSRIHIAQGKIDAALEDLNKAVALNPGNLMALMLRSSVYQEKGEKEKAMADIDQALAIKPNDAATVRARGLALADMEKYDQALVELDKAIALAPKDGSTYEAKAIVLSRLKRYDESLAALDKAKELSPKSEIPLLHQSRVHIAQGKLDAALEDLNKAIALNPGNLTVLMLRSSVYQEKGEKAKAMADIDQALTIKPDLSVIVRTRALLLAEDKRIDEAVGELEKLRKLDPKDLLTMLQLGMLYTVQKKSAKAVECFDALLAEAPDEWRALEGRADSYLNLGKHAQAIADYEKALKLQPKDSGILNNFAWVLATSPDDKLRDGKRAVQLATEACELTEYKLPHILSTLAAAYAETGDFDSAIKWSSKAVEIGEKDHDADLKKELENYKAKKPTRELLTEEKPADKPADKPAGK